MCEWVNGITVCLVNARAIDVFTQQVVIAVVFGNYVVAGIQVLSAVAIDFLFHASAEQVMFAANRNR